MKHSTKTIHTVRHRVELDAGEIHRLICRSVLAPESAMVSNMNDSGDIVVEWDVVREEPTLNPPRIEFDADVIKSALAT